MPTFNHRPITSRAEWLGWRRHYIGASEIAAAAGVDKFKSRARLYAEKADGAPATVETGAMKRGRLFESAALEYLKEERPTWLIERPNVYITDDEHRIACTPDALTRDKGKLVCIQIKTISRPTFERWAVDVSGTVHPPLGYVLQVITENMLLDATSGILCVLVVSAYDAELKLFDVPRHPGAEARIVAIAAEFWDDVANGRRPQPDFTRDADLITEMFPKPDPGKTIDLVGDNRLAAILKDREELKDVIDAARKAMEGIDAEVKFKLGDAWFGELPGWRLTWRHEHRKEYTVEASDRRVLRVKQIEEKETAA
jgi:putative phage-type endonuclease